MRIEFTERFEVPIPESELDRCDREGQPYPEPEWDYRRIYIRLEDILAPKEMPGKKRHCYIETYDGTMLIVKMSYDDACNLIDQREAQAEGDSEYEEGDEE